MDMFFLVSLENSSFLFSNVHNCQDFIHGPCHVSCVMPFPVMPEEDVTKEEWSHGTTCWL